MLNDTTEIQSAKSNCGNFLKTNDSGFSTNKLQEKIRERRRTHRLKET